MMILDLSTLHPGAGADFGLSAWTRPARADACRANSSL